MFTTVKRTLCELVLAAGALGLTGCISGPTNAPREYAEESVENVVQHAIGYFNNKEYETLIDLISKRTNYLDDRNKKIAGHFKRLGIYAPQPEQKLSASEQTLYALAYAMNGNYPEGRMQFTNLMNDFKNKPAETVLDIEKLKTFFTGEQYEKAENFAISGTLFYSEMNAVVGFLKFARKDYEGARRFFRRAIPNFEESTVHEYRCAFSILLLEAAKNGADDKIILEYAKTVEAVYGVKGKEPEKSQN
jgi:hypothetical protein